ncbi:MAG: hydrolase [Rhodocyclaceae bacterium]|nr:hydrolase [Rhodocyclaceae bacterium]
MTALRALLLSIALLLAACASPWPYAPDPSPIGSARLPPANTKARISGLGPCTDSADRTLSLARGEPVTVLVHGCRGSAGKFRSLAEVLAFHGRRSACFSYDDRDSLTASAGRLALAVNELAKVSDAPQITLIGHSQGGLVARKAVVRGRETAVDGGVPIDLVTVSAPFAGIRSANPCALPWLRVATLGLNDLMCWLISGDKWFQITSASDFIRFPGPLADPVRRHLMIVTDESGSCRQHDADGNCRVSDHVFALDEQGLPDAVGAAPLRVELRAGHVAVVGYPGASPDQLIETLQHHAVIPETAAGRREALQRLLARLYR